MSLMSKEQAAEVEAYWRARKEAVSIEKLEEGPDWGPLPSIKDGLGIKQRVFISREELKTRYETAELLSERLHMERVRCPGYPGPRGQEPNAWDDGLLFFESDFPETPEEP